MQSSRRLLLATLAVCVAILSACEKVTPTPTVCSPSTTATSAIPGSLLAIDGIPNVADSVTAFYGTQELMVAQLEGGESAILVPYFSAEDLFASGPVTVDMHVDGEACTGFDVQVRGLPSPTEDGVSGAFERFVTDASTTLDATLEESGLTLDEIRAVSETGSPLHPFLFLADYLVRGEDNPNSLERVLHEGTVAMDGEVIELDMEVMDGILSLAYSSSQELNAAPGLSPAQTYCMPVHHCFHASTIEGLSELMNRQYQAEHVKMPATAIAVVVASGAAVLIPGLGTFFGGVALAATLYKWAIVAADVYRLPYTVDMYFDVTHTQLEEDGTGQWYGLTLYPMDKGGANVYQALFDLAVSTIPGGDKLEELILTIVGSLDLPEWDVPLPYDWGAVPITPEQAPQWVSAIDQGTIAVLLDGTGSYEGTTTGTGTVTLRLKPEKFNYQVFDWTVEVEVLPIEITLLPDYQEVQPGDSACIAAVIKNSTNPQFFWEDELGVSESPTYCWSAPSIERMEVECQETGAIRHEVWAISSSRTGARQPKYSPPSRKARASVVVRCPESTSELTGTLTISIAASQSNELAQISLHTELTFPVSIDASGEFMDLPIASTYSGVYEQLTYSHHYGLCPEDRRWSLHEIDHPANADTLQLDYIQWPYFSVSGYGDVVHIRALWIGEEFLEIDTPEGPDCPEDYAESQGMGGSWISIEVPPGWLSNCESGCSGTYESPPDLIYTADHGDYVGWVGFGVFPSGCGSWETCTYARRTLSWDLAPKQ